MSELRPRRTAHRGSVSAAGLLFDLTHTGEAEARRRVLAHWQRGARLLALDAERWLLLLPAAQRVQAETCVAAPLVRDGRGALSTAPLTPRELERLSAAQDSVVVVRAGVAEVFATGALRELDPAEWLDIAGFSVLIAAPLSAAAGAQPARATMPPARSARELLGPAIPPVAPERDAALDELAQRAAAGERPAARASAGASVWSRLRAAWLRLRSRLRRRAQRKPPTPAQQTLRSGRAAAARPSRWTRLIDWLNARVARLLSRTLRLPQRHARYLADLLEMFERGDLHNALRHAIPLADERLETALRGPQVRLGPPTPRSQLEISPTRAESSDPLHLANDLFAHMRATYERAARTLEAQGRHDEAAFVWAELLGDAETAVAALERHGQLRKAAELAEGRGLAPGLVVRLWFLAKDEPRALALARAHGAFADAIARLEASTRHSDAARRLRLQYGDTLAQAGDYAGAVDALWPVDEARPLAVRFLAFGVDAGGTQAGRSLARMLAVGAEAAPALMQRVRRLVNDGTANAAVTRLAFAQALLAERRHSPTIRSGARAVLRALLADVARGLIAWPRESREHLIVLAADALLRADLPAQPARAPRTKLELCSTPLEQCIVASDRGGVSVHDAALLPDGRLLVALGEIGLRVYRPERASFQAFFQPAHRLVLNSAATRAIALARRGRVYRLARLDLIGRRAEDWCDAEIDRFAPEFDGTRWFIAARGDLLAVDATAGAFQALWRVGQVSAEHDGFVDICAGSETLELLIRNGSADEYWRYDLRTLSLRTRSDKSLAPHAWPRNLVRRLSPGASEVAGVSSHPTRPKMVVLEFRGTSVELAEVRGGLDQTGLQLRADWAAVSLWNPAGCDVSLVDLARMRVALRLRLEGAARVRMRLTEHALVVADDLGRVRAVSLRDGRVLCDLRVQA